MCHPFDDFRISLGYLVARALVMGSLFSYACAARCRRGRGERAAGGAGSNALNALLGFLLRQTPRVFHLNSLILRDHTRQHLPGARESAQRAPTWRYESWISLCPGQGSSWGEGPSRQARPYKDPPSSGTQDSKTQLRFESRLKTQDCFAREAERP